MKHNHQKEGQNIQSKKARMNDKIANKNGHQNKRDQIPPKKEALFSPVFGPASALRKNFENHLLKKSTEIQLA